MITGIVRDGEAQIKLKVNGPHGHTLEIKAMIDTGYSGFLTLPAAEIAALRLTWRTAVKGTLADGSECLFDVFNAVVNWDGNAKRISVDRADTDPLVGMELLNGYELNVQVRPRGKVVIKPLK